MEEIRRNVWEIGRDERRTYENALGHKLSENQQIIIQVISVDADAQQPDNGAKQRPLVALPNWCNVCDGLSDEEIAEVESVALQRSDMTRPSE